jgi:hypothetical protein
MNDTTTLEADLLYEVSDGIGRSPSTGRRQEMR